MYLEDLCLNVVVASKPQCAPVFDGHDCINERPCGDALIIDYNMPKMNGLEFVELLDMRGCKGLLSNVLIMTGNIDEVDVEKATQLGCCIMQKPVKFDALKTWLMNIPLFDL